MVKAMREHFATGVNDDNSNLLDDRALIERHVERVIVKLGSIEIELTAAAGQDTANHDADLAAMILIVPWSTRAHVELKGILHPPLQRTSVNSANRDSLAVAIAKARGWIKDLLDGRVPSFADIAEREGRVERHIRLLATLAFVSPRLILEIFDGALPPDLTVTGLAKRLAYSWAEQDSNWRSGS